MGSFGRWSAYGSFGRTLRLLFFSTNLLSVMLSIACLAYGGWLVAKRSRYAELLAPSLYVDVGRIMIVVSIIAIVNCAIAVYSVVKELRCAIYSFSVSSFIIFVMLFIGGIMGFVFRYQIPLQLKMLTSLRELYGTAEMEMVTEAWDELQTNFKCCGVNGTDDYRIWPTSKWYMHQKTPKHRLPISCCVADQTDACIEANLEVSNSTLFYTETCYMPLRSDLLAVVRVAAWLSIISSFAVRVSREGCLGDFSNEGGGRKFAFLNESLQLMPGVFASLYARLIRK